MSKLKYILDSFKGISRGIGRRDVAKELSNGSMGALHAPKRGYTPAYQPSALMDSYCSAVWGPQTPQLGNHRVPFLTGRQGELPGKAFVFREKKKRLLSNWTNTSGLSDPTRWQSWIEGKTSSASPASPPAPVHMQQAAWCMAPNAREFPKSLRASLSSAAELDGPRQSVEDTNKGLINALDSAVVVEGTIQKVHFRSEDTAYTVLRLKLGSEFADCLASVASLNEEFKKAGAHSNSMPLYNKRRRKAASAGAGSANHVTVVGTMQKVLPGQKIRVEGSWTIHHQYGVQVKARNLEEIDPGSDEQLDFVAYLSGGVIAGVGPATARLMVARWGDRIFDILDSEFEIAVKKLREIQGIGLAKAKSIKENWDRGREAREASLFLRKLGFPPAMAQKVSESLGQRTAELVSRDPYLSLKSTRVPLILMDKVAAQLGVAPDLVSRASAVLERSLKSAAEAKGHTYLTWRELQRNAENLFERLECNGGNTRLAQPELLRFVAQHMQATGELVVETDDLDSAYAKPADMIPFAGSYNYPSLQGALGTSETLDSLVSDAFVPDAVNEDCMSLVRERIPSATDGQLHAMFEVYGSKLPVVFSAPRDDAIRLLVKCKKIGNKTAGKLKSQWDSTETNTFGKIDKPCLNISRFDTKPFGIRIEDLFQTPMYCDPTHPWSEENRCYLPELHQAESTVAQLAAEKASFYRPTPPSRLKRIRAWIDANQESDRVSLSQGQRAAIEAASDSPLLVITGGPGCGKTTVVKAIVKLWCAQGKMVRICAPTGRAAQRMGVIQANEPSTIHRLLGYQPRRSTALSTDTEKDGSALSSMSDGDGDEDLDGEGYFTFDKDHRLPCHAVLVDEASMLNLPLAAALMRALKSKTQLVLVGDVDQLPPIGPGGVLHALIDSKIAPVIDLREIFRQEAASAIVNSALAVRRGHVPPLDLRAADQVVMLSEEDISLHSNALLFRSESPAAIPDLVYRIVKALSQRPDFSEKDLQVISPMKKGVIGTSALNPRLKELLNANFLSWRKEATRLPPMSDKNNSPSLLAWNPFHVGDRVLQLVNNYDKDVFNGDQGYVVQVSRSENSVVVEFPSIDVDHHGVGVDNVRRPVPRDHHPTSEAHGTGHDLYPEFTPTKRYVTYQGPEISQLELAYAITVHKAQGGEARHVILVLAPQHRPLLTRQLLYTGLARARELLVVVTCDGDPDPISLAVKRLNNPRSSSLSRRMDLAREAAGLSEKDLVVFTNEDELLASRAASGAVDDEGGRDTSLKNVVFELGGDVELVESLMSNASFGNGMPLISADVARSHLELLKKESACVDRPLPPLDVVLRRVPLLLQASSEYFTRSLMYSKKLGSLPKSEVESITLDREDCTHTESLVDQLRRLLY